MMKRFLCVVLVLSLIVAAMPTSAQASAADVISQYPNTASLAAAAAAVGMPALESALAAVLPLVPAALAGAALGVIIGYIIATGTISNSTAQTLVKSTSLKKLNDAYYCSIDQYRRVVLLNGKNGDARVGLKFIDNQCLELHEAIGVVMGGANVWTQTEVAAAELAGLVMVETKKCGLALANLYRECDTYGAHIDRHTYHQLLNGYYEHYHVYSPTTPAHENYWRNGWDANIYGGHIFFGVSYGTKVPPYSY